MTEPSTGVIYVASGGGYLELAEASATSLKATNPGLSVCLFTDTACGNPSFDDVREIPNHCRRSKISGMIDSPFDRTLFLDCDTLVLADVSPLFDILERFDLLISHDVRRSSELIERGVDPKISPVFCQHNSGVMAYRKNQTVDDFLNSWAASYDANGAGRDQITLKDLLWDSDIRFWVLPEEWNFRRVTQLDAWEPLDTFPRIIHNHQLLRHLRTHDDRVHALSEILELERGALKQEWQMALEKIPELNTVPFEKWHETVKEYRHRLRD